MTSREAPVYVLDTHALYWYWTDSRRLGSLAASVFRALDERRGIGLVPLIVLAELYYLSRKLRRPWSMEHLLSAMDRAPALRLEDVTRRHLRAFDQLEGIPEMHDRLIGAVALIHGAPVVSRDRAFSDHPLISKVW